MKEQEFKQSCYQQLLAIFEKAKLRQKDQQQKYRVEGYIHAGKQLEIITHEQAIAMMEKAHFQVFGETIEARKAKKLSIKEALIRGDEEYINIPAYERNKK